MKPIVCANFSCAFFYRVTFNTTAILPEITHTSRISLAFSEINREYQYPVFIFERLAYMLNFGFLFCSITYIPLTLLVLHAQNHSSITIKNKLNCDCQMNLINKFYFSTMFQS